jgi:hypothetical protein
MLVVVLLLLGGRPLHGRPEITPFIWWRYGTPPSSRAFSQQTTVPLLS